MSIKNIFIYGLVLSFAITSIYSKEENDRKFLSLNPLTYQNEAPELKSFSEDDHKVINIKCLYSKDYNIYTLQELENEDDDYKIKNNNDTIRFNFCKNTKKVKNATFYKLENNSEFNITRLSGSIEGEEDNKNKWEQNEDKNGVVIHFNQGDQCTEKEKYQVILEVKCNPDNDKEEFKENPSKFMKIFYNDSNPCTYKMEMESLYGCSLKSSYLMSRLFEDYKIVFTIIFVVFGLLLCIKGNSMVTVTLIIVCGIVGCYSLTAFVLNAFPNFITTELWLFICMIVSLVLGCLIGFFLKGNVKAAIILLGGFLGYSCAIFVYQIVLNYVEFDPEIVYYVCIGVCIIIGALISWKLSRVIIIIGTSVFGGYLVMRGISFVAGNYLDEGYVIDLLKNKEFEQLEEIRDGWIYAYLACWIILSILGIYIQCKKKDKEEEKS